MIEIETIKVIEAYLIHGIGHRNIEETILNIPSSVRGGGFKAMTILHNLGITGEKKGILKNKSIDDEIKNASGDYLNTLKKYKEYQNKAGCVISIPTVKASAVISSESKKIGNTNKTEDIEIYSKETININGIDIPLYKNNDETIQDFVKKILFIMFENNLLPENEIENMTRKDYCTKTFGISYQIISKNKSNRYWKDKISEYYVCSQWAVKNEATYKIKLSNWIKRVKKINDDEEVKDDWNKPQNDVKKINSKRTSEILIKNQQKESSYKIAKKVREIILSINENCKLRKKKDIFDQAALFKLWGNIEKSCKSKSDFKGFAENLYKLLRENTRYKNPNKKSINDSYYIYLLPDNFIKKDPTKHFWDIVNTFRHYFVHDEIENIADVYKELLDRGYGPESKEDYLKLQIKVLNLFENAMKILLDMIKNE